MKKIYRSAAAAMMVFAAASCQNEDIQVQQDIQGQEFILEATFGAPTRTTLEEGTLGGYQTVWSEGDQILVCSADGRSKGILTLSQGAGEKSGKFRGFVSGDASQIVHAIFPVPKNGVIDLSNVDAGEVDAPMTAGVSGGNASFSNACAMIKLNIVNIESDEVVKLTCDKRQEEVALLGGLFKIVQSDETSISGIASGEDFFVPINYSGAPSTTEPAKVEVFIGDATEAVEMNVQVGTGQVTVKDVPDMVVGDGELIDPTKPATMPENMVYVTSDDELTAALNNKEIENIVLAGNTTFTTKIHTSYASGRNSLNIIGSKGTKVQFAENVLVSHIGKFEIQNCEILKRTNKWGMLLMGSWATGINSVVKITNCDFKGVGNQGIYINETRSGVVYDIEKCTFDGDFGGEGAITIQNNKIDFTVNVNGCTFNNIPETSHKVYVMYNNPFALNTDLADSDIFWKAGKPSAE